MDRRSSLVTMAHALLPTSLVGAARLASAGPALRIVTEEFPPYNLTEQGKVTGFSTEVVEAVLKEVGVAAPIQSMPWARAYDTALNTENVLIYSITYTAAREKLFKWVGVVAPSDWHLFTLRGGSARPTSLADAQRFQVATVNEDAGEQFLASQGFVLGKNLQSSTKYELNYEKLKRGRVDLWIANDLVAHHLVRQAGDDPVKVLVRALPVPELGREGLFMAFSLKTPDATVARFRKGLEAVKKDGRYDALKKKWL